MSELVRLVAKDLAAYYEMVRDQAHQWVDGLVDVRKWGPPQLFVRQRIHSLMHMTGNLDYYIGARVGETGYVRDRDREFAEPQPKPKAEVLAAFDRTIAMVIETIEKQGAEDWLKEYSGLREPEAAERFAIFLRCAGHAYHHVGQLIYLSRELTM